MSNEKVWNPFKKGYWTKENLSPDVQSAKATMKEAKEEFKKIDWNEKTDAQIKAEKVGNKISRIGWKLTLGVTIPILLTVFFGVFGLIIGIIIFCLVMFKK